jgi:hypothetical protein
MNWIAILLLFLAPTVGTPALAQNGTTFAERLGELAGDQRPAEVWDQFVRDAAKWADANSLLQLHLELGNVTTADALIDRLLVSKLDETLYGAPLDLPSLGGLYHLVSLRKRNDEAFQARYAPLRRRLSDAFYADFRSRKALRSNLRQYVDWAYLTIRFPALSLEEQYRLFILLLNDNAGTSHAPTREEMRAMWKTIEPGFQDRENRRRFQRVFAEIAKWEANPLIDTRSLDWEARQNSRIPWFFDELQIAFPAGSYEAVKLELFARLDPFSRLFRDKSYSKGDLALTNFQKDAQNRELVRRYFRAVMTGGHALKTELEDPGLVHLIRNLDFRLVFRGFEGELDDLTYDLLETLLATRTDFNGELRTLSLWDQVIGAFSHGRIQALPDYGIFKRAWPVYLRNVRAFDFNASPFVNPAELARFRTRHLQTLARLALIEPSLFQTAAPGTGARQYADPSDEALLTREREPLYLGEEREVICNLAVQSQN